MSSSEDNGRHDAYFGMKEKFCMTNLLQDLFKRHFKSHFDGVQVTPCHVLGFVETKEPRIVGFISFDPKAPKGLTPIKIWHNMLVNPDVEDPCAFLAAPSWLKGFRISACLWSVDEEGRKSMDKALNWNSVMKAVISRVTRAGMACAIRMLWDQRAFFNKERDVGFAIDDAPLLHKRLLLSFLKFPVVDLMEPSMKSKEKISIPDACAGAARSEPLVFYIFEDHLNRGIVDKLTHIHNKNINIVVIDRLWGYMCPILYNIVSIDGAVLMELSPGLDVFDVMKCHLRQPSEPTRAITRSQIDWIANEALAWTAPLLYSERLINNKEFEDFVATHLEGASRRGMPDKFTRAKARLVALRLRREPLRQEFTWYDQKHNTVKKMRHEMNTCHYSRIFESCMEPEPGTGNIFTAVSGPCDIPNFT